MFEGIATALARHMLNAAGMAVATTGLISETDAMTAVGALLTLSQIVWSVLKEVKRAKPTEAAVG